MTAPLGLSLDLSEIRKREIERVEWKKTVADVDDVVATIVAFANDFSNLGGGYVVCGADEIQDENGFQKMTLPGLSATRLKELEGKVLTLCRERVSPPVVPLIEELPSETESNRVLVFVIPGSQQAHTFRNRNGETYYTIRISRETRIARNGLLRELLTRKNVIDPWDRRVNPRSNTEDIDLIIMREYFKRMALWDPSSHYASGDRIPC